MLQIFNTKFWSITISACQFVTIYLKFRTLGGTWEGYDVTDVLHTGDEQDETLEAQSETCVRT